MLHSSSGSGELQVQIKQIYNGS